LLLGGRRRRGALPLAGLLCCDRIYELDGYLPDRLRTPDAGRMAERRPRRGLAIDVIAEPCADEQAAAHPQVADMRIAPYSS